MEIRQHMYAYEKDGAEIYRQSFATIRAETDLRGLPEDVARVVVRMIHACGQVDLVHDVAFSPAVAQRAREALDAGAPVLCDVDEPTAGLDPSAVAERSRRWRGCRRRTPPSR
jgi:precorrin-8X/cobalt-precorrin-8 methylmutase